MVNRLKIVYAMFVLVACHSLLATSWPVTPERFLETHTNHSLVNEFVLSLYRNLTKGMPIDVASGRPREWKHMHNVDTVRSFPAIGSFEGHAHLAFKFNMTVAMSTTETLLVAEIRMMLPEAWSHFRQLYATAVTSISKRDDFTSSVSVARLHSSASRRGRPIHIFNVTKIVSEVLQYVRNGSAVDEQNEESFTIKVILMGVNHRKPSTRSKIRRRVDEIVRHDMGTEKSTSDVILVVYTEAPMTRFHSRQKRQTTDENLAGRLQERAANNGSLTVNTLHGPCRRREMDVDFAAIGWGEWVVYPTHFNAFQCHGRCSSYADSRSNPTNHAIVQSLVRLVGHRDVFPMACCAPTRLSPLSILYMEKGSVVIKHHEDMIVEECGCM